MYSESDAAVQKGKCRLTSAAGIAFTKPSCLLLLVQLRRKVGRNFVCPVTPAGRHVFRLLYAAPFAFSALLVFVMVSPAFVQWFVF